MIVWTLITKGSYDLAEIFAGKWILVFTNLWIHPSGWISAALLEYEISFKWN